MGDRDVLRQLAGQWMELASDPVMAERVRQWTAVKDLQPERPMVLFETWSLMNYVPEAEITCEDPTNRYIEWLMRSVIRHGTEIGDDFVIEPVWRVGWHIRSMDYGVPLQSTHAEDVLGGHVAYRFDHPIRTVEDIKRLRTREWSVDRDSTYQEVERLQQMFGDILPVVLHGTTFFHANITGDLFRLIGNDNLMTWVVDEPDAIHALMSYLCDDRIRYFRWLEEEGLIGLNNNSTAVGSGSPGYTRALPAPDYKGRARLKDVWIWIEAQECAGISPRMFAEMFLPYLAEVGNLFGLVYYGCCEAVHDRWDAIISAMPNVRAVSVSPWCHMEGVASRLNGKVVFSRKPRPAPISGEVPDWAALREDVEATLQAAQNCPLEIIFRDVYRINDDRPRLRKWVDMVRSLMA